MEESIKVPRERIAALIGKEGKTRREIEKITKTSLKIESDSGTVTVERKEYGLDFYNALNIIKAIARGFAPEKAFLLSNEEYYLDVVDLNEAVGKSKKQIEVKKGRVIGRKGKARESIEKETNCFISVYGKTIALIGKAEDIETARRAVEMLLQGAKHTTMLEFLEKKQLEGRKFEL